MSSSAIDKVRAFIEETISSGGIDKESDGWRLNLPRFPEVEYASGDAFTWHLETSEGDIDIRLMPDIAPNHVTNYIYLTELGYFDGLNFHRVIDGFMAQGGCPEGSGAGGPGYNFDGEFSPEARHDRPGLLSMANRGPGTDGSQFFITFVHTPHLDDNHTVFGEVVDGMETVQALEANGSRSGQTSKDMRIVRASIKVG